MKMSIENLKLKHNLQHCTFKTLVLSMIRFFQSARTSSDTDVNLKKMSKIFSALAKLPLATSQNAT